MAEFSIQQAQADLPHLLELAERGEEVIVEREGRPVARLVPVASPKGILGCGIGDANYRSLPDELALAPASLDELKLWYGNDL